MHPPDKPGVNFSGLSLDELRLYFTLTRRVEAPQVEVTELPRAAFEPQLVPIPSGSFLMGSSDTYIEQAPKMLRFLADRTDVVYESLEHYPDYYTNYEGARAGHRSLEPRPIDMLE